MIETRICIPKILNPELGHVVKLKGLKQAKVLKEENTKLSNIID
jgi:hypothetical protein